MKRGLVLPPEPVHEERLDALRARMAEAGADVALVYGDVSRSDDIAHLTNLCVYWNEGVVGVPAEGEPALLSKLSKRVHPWMRETSTLNDLRSGRDLAKLLAEFAGDARRVGLVDRDVWPAQLVDELGEACGAELVDLPDAVRADRLVPEAGRVRELGARLGAALEATGGAAGVERELRAAGALDVIAVCHEAADGSVTLDVRVQQYGMWLRAARCEGGRAAERVSGELAAAAEALRAGDAPGPGVRLTSHADLAPGAPHRDADEARPGEVVIAEVASEGAIAAAPFLLEAGGAESLTRSEGHAGVG